MDTFRTASRLFRIRVWNTLRNQTLAHRSELLSAIQDFGKHLKTESPDYAHSCEQFYKATIESLEAKVKDQEATLTKHREALRVAIEGLEDIAKPAKAEGFEVITLVKKYHRVSKETLEKAKAVLDGKQ